MTPPLLTIVPVTDERQINLVADLAQRIWTEHYTPLIGAEQVSYMLKHLQSPAAIRQQMTTEGYHYFLLQSAEEAWVGYCAVIPRPGELFLSKLYVVASCRGRGYGRYAVTFLEHYARERHLPKIALTVNKRNTNSIAAYKAFGFSIIDAFITDIGGGFVMDDYRMEKAINN